MNSTGTQRPNRWAGIAVLIVCAGGAFWFLTPSLSTPPEAYHRMACKNNLKQIGLALHNYHDTFGCFPPAITYGPDGKPWHSWRALIAPYIEAKSSFQYRLDEPWDGPHNRALAAKLGPVPAFQCPSDVDAAPGTTNYFAVVGENTMWPPGGVKTFADAADGMSFTAHVVEVSDSGVHWMEPVDLRLDAMRFGIGPRGLAGIRSRHGGTEHWIGDDVPWQAHVELADGSVRMLSETTPPEIVRSLLIRDDGGPEDF